MGWTYTEKPQDVKRYLLEQNTWENNGTKATALDCKIVNMREAYIATRFEHDGQSYVTCLVYLLDFNGQRDFEFGYKDMCETMGVHANNCPASILKLLSPTDQLGMTSREGQQWAQEWRDRCQVNIDKRQQANGLKHGDVIRFAEPIRFSNGTELDTFTLHKHGRRVWFEQPNNAYSPVYKISNWRRYDFTKLEGANHA